MSDDLTLPGTIDGLLRRGSPIVGQRGSRGLVLELTNHDVMGDGVRAWHYAGSKAGFAPLKHVSLDLRDPTGRCHAAWWANDRCSSSDLLECDLTPAMNGRDMTDDEIRALRDLCLRLAGLEVTT